jgi:hypothetical protein
MLLQAGEGSASGGSDARCSQKGCGVKPSIVSFSFVLCDESRGLVLEKYFGGVRWMGEFSKWLLHEDQKEFFDYLFALVLNIVFVAAALLLLWPLGESYVAGRLAKGYWIFWTVLIATSGLMVLAQRIFRMDLYERYNAYVISGLVVSGFIQLGWSAWVAPVVRTSAADTSVGVAMVLYGVGLLSCYVASVIVGVFYMGGLYRLVNSTLAFLSFILFSLWPAAGTKIYGWFFDLF